MKNKLSQKEDFLLKEYDTAVQLTFHVDQQRSQFTNLFITITGAAAIAVSLLIQEDLSSNIFGKFEFMVGIFLILIAVMGFFVVAIVAKLRRIQLEHFRIANNIRKYFLGTDYSFWNIVELSGKTLPKANRTSGTYYWLMIIMLLNSYIIALVVYLFFAIIWQLTSPQISFVLSTITVPLFIFLQDMLYFRLATSPDARIYSKTVPPE